MKDGPDISRSAALIGDPARANMLAALMAGRALTASELAAEAGITAATASSHLARLLDGGLIAVRAQGRHRYYALAGPGVARAIEALTGLAAATGMQRSRPGPRDPALRAARVCYDHLAGARGIQTLRQPRRRRPAGTGASGLTLSAAGRAGMTAFGIDLAMLEARRAPLCRECLDWSERRSHLAGGLGRALYARIEALGWAGAPAASRAVVFTAAGAAAFDRRFPVAVPQAGGLPAP